MDTKSKLEYQMKIEKYLEDNKVYDIFEDLTKALIISQPSDPIDFLIKKLSEPEQKRIFIVGPPASGIRELALDLSVPFQCECTSVGDLLKKECDKKTELGQQIEHSIRNVQYVSDDIVIKVVKKQIQEYEKEKKNYILEGFPKTRVQGLALQRDGIIPNTFIILNVPEPKIQQQCLHKINNSDGYYNHIKGDEKETMSKNLALEYSFNIQQVKEIYHPFYFLVDDDNSREDIREDMARLMKFKIKQNAPKRSARILILGPPGSGRSTLGKNLAQKYGFVYVSTSELINDQIARKTNVGQHSLNLVGKGELIDDEIVKGLIKSRIQNTDCHLHGYVIDGYPKNLSQLLNLEDVLQTNPSLIIILECSDEVIFKRFEEKKRASQQETQPNETRDVINKRIKRWKELLKSVEQNYSHLIFKLNSNISQKNILERVSFQLENSA